MVAEICDQHETEWARYARPDPCRPATPQEMLEEPRLWDEVPSLAESRAAVIGRVRRGKPRTVRNRTPVRLRIAS